MSTINNVLQQISDKMIYTPSIISFNEDTGVLSKGGVADENQVFVGITKIGQNALSKIYENNTTIKTVDFPVLVEVESNGCYYAFSGCKNLVEVKSLPATILGNYCYASMFRDCTKLTIPPVLPATTLANSCYFSMFYGCTNLTTSPILNVDILKDNCYTNMFYGCSSLTVPPELPATQLAKGCYNNMFAYSGLSSLPELPATTLANECYYGMFRGCHNLTGEIELPDITLVAGCYGQMFWDTNITSVHIKTSTIEGQSLTYFYPLNNTFWGCKKLTTATFDTDRLPAGTCYEVFNYCTALTDIYLPNLTYYQNSNKNYEKLCNNTSNVKVHLKIGVDGSNWDFGGTNTTIINDL